MLPVVILSPGFGIPKAIEGGVELYPCGDEICGKLCYWLKDNQENGSVSRDTKNPDPAKRDRPLCHMQFMGGFVPDSQGHYEDGWIYSPRHGANFSAEMTLADHETLEACVGIAFPFPWRKPDLDTREKNAEMFATYGAVRCAMRRFTEWTFFLTILVVIAALAFDFVNGFHDAANSIATIVATRVLKPRQAVLWAAFFNFAALFLFGTGVAKTVGSGMIALDAVTPLVILAGLIGAIAWGLITWWLGLPTSSSHALLGGYAGAAMTNSALRHGWGAFYDPILAFRDGLTQCIFIVIAPIIGIGHRAYIDETDDCSRPKETPIRTAARIKFLAGCNCFPRPFSASCMAAMTRRKLPASSPAHWLSEGFPIISNCRYGCYAHPTA